MQGLARVALLSARAIVWPDLPCYNTSWLSFKDHSPPFEEPGCLLPHHVDGTEAPPQCLMMQSLHNHCLLVGDAAQSGCTIMRYWQHACSCVVLSGAS